MKLFARVNKIDDDWIELIEQAEIDGIMSEQVFANISVDYFLNYDRNAYDRLNRGETVEIEITVVKGT